MSLMKEVTAAIRERGPSTVDDILPMFPGIERIKLRNAINNAAIFGYLKLYEIGRYPGNGGRFPAKFAVPADCRAVQAPRPAPNPRAVSSVWNLGAA